MLGKMKRFRSRGRYGRRGRRRGFRGRRFRTFRVTQGGITL